MRNPLDRVSAPLDLLGTLRVLPDIARHTAAMAKSLRAVEGSLVEVSAQTEVLPSLGADMSAVAEATATLGPMDERMATIAGAMPTLVEVQKSLVDVPTRLAQLDANLGALSAQLQELTARLDELGASIVTLQGSIGPLGRLAQRLPGGRRAAARAAAEADGEAADLDEIAPDDEPTPDREG